MHLHLRTCFAAAALVALNSCANTGAPAGKPAATSPVEAAFTREAAVGDAGETAAEAQTRRTNNAEVELELWNRPDFKRWFAASYLAESEVEPRTTTVERDQLQAIFEAMSEDRMDKALTELGKRRGAEANAVFDFTLANIHFQNEELDTARDLYALAVDKYPKFRRAWRNMALIDFRQGEFEKAAAAFTKVIELGGNDAVTYGLLAYSYSNLEDHIAAESAYRMAVLLEPRSADWRMGLARSFFKQQRYADAVALCDALIAVEPERADLWLLQANALLGLGKPMDAARNYEFVESLGRSTPESLQMLADIYVNEELFDLAVERHVSALEMSDAVKVDRAVRAAKVLTSRGALGATRRLVESVDRLRGSTLSDAERKDVLKLRARLAVADGAGEAEATVLREIVELDPLDGEALILLGQHSARGGDPEQAIFYFERAANLEAFEANAKVHHAQLLVGQSRYAEALPLLRRAQTLSHRDNIQEYLEQVERVSQGR
mgnify:CR=1 FL=1